MSEPSTPSEMTTTTTPNKLGSLCVCTNEPSAPIWQPYFPNVCFGLHVSCYGSAFLRKRILAAEKGRNGIFFFFLTSRATLRACGLVQTNKIA